MQPFKYGQVIAMWLLRISIVLYVFLGNINRITPIDLQDLKFYIAISLVLFSVLLLIGGFISKPWLTVVSGLIIFLISAYQLVIAFNGKIDLSLAVSLFPLSIGFFFFCQGNK